MPEYVPSHRYSPSQVSPKGEEGEGILLITSPGVWAESGMAKIVTMISRKNSEPVLFFMDPS